MRTRYRLAAGVTGVCVLGGGLWLALTAGNDRPGADSAHRDRDLLDRYCVDCHNNTDRAGDVAFDRISPDHPGDGAEVWESTVRKLRTGLMPPADRPRPQRAVLDAFALRLETRLDGQWEERPNPGAEGASRLNRAEYANAVRDLLAFDAAHVVSTLPSDETIGGFDNIAAALSISPTLVESYVSAAMRISREAVGDRTMIPTEVRYDVPGRAQDRHVDGLPLGTRGGMLLTHSFPLDAEYEIRVNAQGAGGVFAARVCDFPAVDISLNGEVLQVDNTRSFRLRMEAGPQVLGVALVEDQRCEGVNELYDSFSPSGAIQSVEIHGPYDPTGPGDTPSRRAIFSCYPSSPGMEEPCLLEILSDLATRAYRRPIRETDPELDPLIAFYRQGRLDGDPGDFETGVQYALSRLLIDPRFLFRLEEEPPGLADGEAYRISDLELASRLSFFLWSSLPDMELIELAGQSRLSDPDVLEQQVLRLLADQRSAALVENFAGQWLKLRELNEALPQDPAFDDSLREAFQRETEALFFDLIRDDRSVLHLLDAPYTYLNERLADHYGIPGVRGSYMRAVSLPESSPRRGLLGQGSILTATSVANRTSPVIRGEWIVENILGAPVPVPPPGVEADLSDASVPEGREVRTLRDRLEMHLENPTCAACHQIIDPVGLALENFDLVGRWRETDNGYPIDTSTRLVDGTPVDGPADMRRALLDRSDAYVTSMTERLLTYALGRIVEHHDMPAVRKIVRDARREDYRFSAMVLGIARSVPFQMKTKTSAGSEAAAESAGEPTGELLVQAGGD